jgi:GDP-4-dehydro-6-deoxy-D-mannose reductase
MCTEHSQSHNDVAAPPCYHQQKVLVTGATGFTGLHCLAALQACGATVATARHRAILPATAPLPQPAVGDLCDGPFVSRMLRDTQPGYIFHLASLTPAREGASAVAMMQTNALGMMSLLEGIHAESPRATTVLISSGAVYGVAAAKALDETQALLPCNAYGASKAAQELVALAMGAQHALRVIRARPFNLLGPGEPPGLVCSAMARQIAAAECGFAPPMLQVGRLDTQRDFLDVRDAVAAYLLLGVHGRPGEAYNVCSGQAVHIREILERLLAMAQVPLQVVRRTLTGDNPLQAQWGSYEKLHRDTGWQPRITLAQSLESLLAWWRHQLVEQGHA